MWAAPSDDGLADKRTLLPIVYDQLAVDVGAFVPDRAHSSNVSRSSRSRVDGGMGRPVRIGPVIVGETLSAHNLFP
jgi:hypothetical protein